MFFHITPYRWRIEQPDTRQHNGIKNSETEMCLWIKINWKPLSLKMSTTLRVRSSGSVFCRNYQRTKGCRSREELVEVIVCTFNTVYCFQLLYIISCISYALYICSTIQSCTRYPRESGSKARNCVYLSKIENSSYYQLVSHPMSVC